MSVAKSIGTTAGGEGVQITSEKKLLKIQVHKEVLITTRKSPVYFRENYFELN
jgi:hypothetical protein